jgi:hypothetical protein
MIMFTITGKFMKFSLNENGQVTSLYNRLTYHEYIHIPDNLWKIIYRENERMEIPIYSLGQSFEVECTDDQLFLTYNRLRGEDRMLDVMLMVRIVMEDDQISVYTTLRSKDEAADIIEISVTAASGVYSLSGDPREDILTIPQDLGKKHHAPALNDLDTSKLYRSYQQYHRDINALYPGNASMQWYELYNNNEGLYIGSHDPSLQVTCLHVERDVKKSTLRLGINRYPFLKKGETWESAPVVYAVHRGDWHAGARIYRRWIENSHWKAPINSEWIQNFKGWTRFILKQQYGKINWDYSQIPALFDEGQAAGFNTIKLIGWEINGFCRMRPDYIPDPKMGGEKGLKKAIEYVHLKGGRVIIYISYFAIDYDTDFYKTGGGKDILLKTVWGKPLIFGEVHSAEGTWRNLPGPGKPQYEACQDTPLWQKKLGEFADIALELGADGVMYDIGGCGPHFCYDTRHPHKKPSQAICSKADNYGRLKSRIQEKGKDKAMLMEHTVDVFGQHMAITQGASTMPEPDHLFELYRYTFPEIIETNRNCAHDEDNYRTNANYSFLYGLRFDMSVYRCNGTLADIPNYTNYVRKLNGLLDQYADHLLKGRFIDDEGFTVDHPDIRAKAYQATDGSVAVVAWNPTDQQIICTIKQDWDPDHDTSCSIGLNQSQFTAQNEQIHTTLEADSVGVYML